MSLPALLNPLLIGCSQLAEDCTPQEVKEDDTQHLPIVWSMANIFLIEIGSLPHPMEEEHCIEWICLESQRGITVKKLNAGDKPQARFYLEDETPHSIYFYCNRHGLFFRDFTRLG